MNFLKKHSNILLILLPAIAIFILTLIPTLTHKWPLSWDVIYHVLYANVYTQYGFVLINPLLGSPVGEKIAYPPLFHFLIAFLGTVFNQSYMLVARALQPFLAFFVILSVTYVGKKFYGNLAGVSAGFLMISSYIVYRIMLPVPENLALIFLPLAVYFFYVSAKNKNIKYAFIAGILLVVIAATHQAALLCLFVVISTLTLVDLLLYRDLNILKNYGAFIFSMVLIVLLAVVALVIFKPALIQNILSQGISAALGYSTSLNYTIGLSAFKYIQYFGIMVLFFAVIGTYFAAKIRSKKDIYIFTWIIILLLLSKAYLIGINVLAPRLLIYIVMPLSILGGFGVSQVYNWLKGTKRFSSDKFRTMFIIAVFSLSLIFGVLTAANPTMGSFYAKTEFGSVQIAPPSSSEVDLANWFKNNGDKNQSILIQNIYTGVFIAEQTGMPINYGFEYLNSSTPRAFFDVGKVGYIVYDKRLVLPAANQTLNESKVNTELFPLFYFNEKYYKNVNLIQPSYFKLVYENNDFIVYEKENVQ
jgi:asparagine N-glycosylation enzyme membrane subunit Stt3